MIEIVFHICMILLFILVVLFFCVSLFLDPLLEGESTISNSLRDNIIFVGSIILALKIYEWV